MPLSNENKTALRAAYQAALQDEDLARAVPRDFARGKASVSDQASFDAFVGELHSSDETIKARAYRQLERFDSNDSGLISVLTSELSAKTANRERYRLIAGDILGRIGDPTAIAQLSTTAQDTGEDKGVRHRCLKALRRIVAAVRAADAAAAAANP